MPDGEEDPKPGDNPPQNGNGNGAGGDADPKVELEKWRALARKHEANALKNADAAKRLADIEESQKTEAEKHQAARTKAEADLAASRRELTVLRVAMRKGLTEAQAKRLIGETEEELEKDADELLETFTAAKQADSGAKVTPPAARPREHLRSGATPGKEPEETDPIKLAAAVPR